MLAVTALGIFTRAYPSETVGGGGEGAIKLVRGVTPFVTGHKPPRAVERPSPLPRKVGQETGDGCLNSGRVLIP